MYLKEITATGFKSFADKLSITLDNKITCIVGPNGSGKSNVVDAVRWVLGEQSVKTLRGDGSMSDVIFSGSKSRNALNVASVTLLFDNTDHYLKIPYEEVSIKRRVYRTGENEYFLNGTKCRLKDIVDLLLDSGIGRDSFNIISQGEVQRIISNSPYDRRIIFEEAAGVLKYKKRKKEALQKLERTHNNLDRVNDIIDELSTQVEPLKQQSIKAKEYLQNKEQLEKYDIALMVYDICDMMEEYKRIKEQITSYNEAIVLLSNQSSVDDVKLTTEKGNLLKIQQDLEQANNNLLEVTSALEKLNSEKQLLKERSKYDSSSDLVNQNIINLKEQYENALVIEHTLEDEINKLETDLAMVQNTKEKQDDEISSLRQKQQHLQNERIYKDKEIMQMEHSLELLKQEIDSGGLLPNSIKTILKEPSLQGIHNCLGNILQTDEKYHKSLEVAISSSKYFIITDTSDNAKEAINYLRSKKLGRATFFPLDVIKPKGIDLNTLDIIEQEANYIGIMADLVSYDPLYRNIVLNQLGNVIVMADIDSANNLSRKINNRYKIITLDGDVIHIGGSMTGGTYNLAKSFISLKQEYEHKQQQVKILTEAITKLDEQLDEVTSNLNTKITASYTTNGQIVNYEELLKNKQQQLLQQKKLLEEVNNELNSLKLVVAGKVDSQEEKLIEAYYAKKEEKEKLLTLIKHLSKQESNCKEIIEQLEANDKLQNTTLRKQENELKELEIKMSKLDVNLDNMLTTLNEQYSLTYEKAKEQYSLDIEVDEARAKLKLYKENVKQLGMVNVSSIEEYERVNTRYEFLINQRNDLLKAQDSLLEIMNEMDIVMKEEFVKTFELVDEEFRKVFKELFHGGTATLKLTDKDNLLETGIEIVASPPGKKLTTISLLSGGEKTLTAISLLFAILNVRSVPFCLFDEVEAALDEANVEQFGKYLNHYKNKTQFLIITHKKKTMEYADTLYGITMQESGVSKLVSVRLNDKENSKQEI